MTVMYMQRNTGGVFMSNLKSLNIVVAQEVVKLKLREGCSLNYKNGKEILPEELLRQVQQYIQGDLIYIPIGEAKRKAWGETNGTREEIKNRCIFFYFLCRMSKCFLK